jgi:hypothetical protein
VRFMSAISSQAYSVEFVVTFPGGEPNAVGGLASLFSPGISAYTALDPGEYDLYVRQTLMPTYFAGPIRISVAAGGLDGALAVDGPDTATVNVLLLDDFP